MLTFLNDWKGEIDIDGKHYTSISDAISDFKQVSDEFNIKLYSATQKAVHATQKAVQSVTDEQTTNTEYRITVKKYMTETASPGFDFMAKWNNNHPMPLRTMTGVIEKETRGMVYMRLHGQAEPVVRCMRCGRPLTNPVSQLYGIGPECMSKLGFIQIAIDDVETIKKRLVEVEWAGWVIKSAIIEQEEI